jgi:hypothetical protein
MSKLSGSKDFSLSSNEKAFAQKASLLSFRAFSLKRLILFSAPIQLVFNSRGDKFEILKDRTVTKLFK